MLGAACQHGCPWSDFSKDIQLRWRMAVISICTTLIQFSAPFSRNGSTDSNYNGKEAVNYPFGISTCIWYLMCSLIYWMSTFGVEPENWISVFAQRIANFRVCLVLIFLLTRILCPPPVISQLHSCMCIGLSLSHKRHIALKIYSDLTVCGWMECFPHCAATPETCDVTQPTYWEWEGQTMALNQSVEV